MIAPIAANVCPQVEIERLRKQRDALLSLIESAAARIEHGGTLHARMLRSGVDLVLKGVIESAEHDPFDRYLRRG